MEPLDFSGMHLVCLIGRNGHGKSALLDGITWALWGKARATSDDDLMHTGSSEMQVEYEFGLAGQRYNVIRKRYHRGKTRKSELEIAVWDEGTGGWQPLTEPSIRVTQARINDILRMDYDTFVNSAFLKQGEADAFTSKSPGQRKDILATILNLSQYDAYAERAKSLAKESEKEAAVLEMRLKDIEEELAQRPQYEEAIRSATLAEGRAKLAMSEAERLASEARLAVQALTSRQETYQALAKRLQLDQRNHAETDQQLRAVQSRLQELEALLVERQAIVDGHQALETARKEEQRWNERLQARRPLEREEQRLQRMLLEARGALERELALARKAMADAQKRAQAQAGLEEKSEKVGQEIAGLEAIRVENQKRRERLAALHAERQGLEQERARLTQEGEKIRERQDVLKAGETTDCPVCKKPLGEDGRQHLEDEYAQQLEAMRKQFRYLQDQERALIQEESAVVAALRSDEHELKMLGALQKQLAQIEASLKQAQDATEALPQLQVNAQALDERLAGDFAPEIQGELATIQTKMETLAYDETAHQRARAIISDLSGVERKVAALEGAIAQEPELRQQVEQLQGRWQREEEQLAADQGQLQTLKAEAAALPQAQQALRAEMKKAEQARGDWEQARDRLVGGEQRLRTLDVQETTHKELSQTLTVVKDQSARYRHLQEAFGPKGIQAMIIEAALPELETEANRLLSRLSDGRMNVRLETQRELKSGGTRETLDIIISDELGSRPYELYSGGEAFRADLALRIALSRLLARRAGAALQTLFIDEGFGTQDAHGRENLVEALHLVKDEFALVLVITHIDELKEQFPVRIQVVKEDGVGSRYYVS
jgi:exonuclease SbcC